MPFSGIQIRPSLSGMVTCQGWKLGLRGISVGTPDLLLTQPEKLHHLICVYCAYP